MAQPRRRRPPDPNLVSAARRACLRITRHHYPTGPCCRCGRPINPNLRWPHPGAWTGDEIIPRSAGGSATDPNNVRPAHYRCNSRHGAAITNARRRARRRTIGPGPTLILDDW